MKSVSVIPPGWILLNPYYRVTPDPMKSDFQATQFQENNFISLFLLQDVNHLQYVASWTRYKELIAILETTLQDIVDRWTDRKVGNANFVALTEAIGVALSEIQCSC